MSSVFTSYVDKNLTSPGVPGKNINLTSPGVPGKNINLSIDSNNNYKYYPAPPVITTYHHYQDVNNDSYLQDRETIYFLDKTIDWIKHDKSFKKLKKFEKYLKGPNGYNIMHKILKLFVRRGNTNWYDLKIQQSLVKDFIKHKLNKIK